MTTQTPQSFSRSGGGSDEAIDYPPSGSSTRERVAQLGDTAKDQAASVAQEAGYQAQDLVAQARHQVREQVDVQKGRLSDLLREIGDDLEQMAEHSDRKGVAADLVRQLASRARGARGYLDGDGDVVGDLRRFARRRPGTFVLGALAAGIVAGRATRAGVAARNRSAEGGTHDAALRAADGYPDVTGVPHDDPLAATNGTTPSGAYDMPVGTTPSGAYDTPVGAYETPVGAAPAEPGEYRPEAGGAYPVAGDPISESAAERDRRSRQYPAETFPPDPQEYP